MIFDSYTLNDINDILGIMKNRMPSLDLSNIPGRHLIVHNQ